ncbi:MAG: DNA mismatch repair endonuclease MutL [Candidatus Neptunochlamydia sp.]|nr:DNA mismatch repair endonuclease MutL [Candidatus Neptunochlamydia sp.]
MSIHLLSDETINKIAAGEVIENPASVVKELVENALDAKSDLITVEIERGGFSLIRISDNGTGMGQEDLLLSLERHATSKIQTAGDLIHILTMGFRGEALASIGTISKMKILTAKEKMDHGYEVSCNGGKMSAPHAAARSQGTTIEVRSLFYNVPARLKFQKTVQASQNTITKLITKFSLAYPEKTFRYFSDGKEMMNLLPGQLKERCREVLGEPFINEASCIDFSAKGILIKGWTGSPVYAKTNRLGQHLFVNGRAVISPQISHAIYEGYGTRLVANLHPTYVLHMSLSPESIDVNVHPQKREIRLREEKSIQTIVRQAVLRGFKGEEKRISAPKIEWSFDSSLKFQETFDDPIQSFTFDSHEEDLPAIGLFDSYLVLHQTALIGLANEGGIYLVDLEAATARVLYERFLKREIAPFQTLLFPLTLEFIPHEKEQLLIHIEEIKTMGIDIRPFGATTFIVDALSPDIEEEKLQGLLESLAQVFDQNLVRKELEKRLALSASYSARSQKKGWALVEAKQITKALLKTSSPYNCPKGMKTIVALSHDAIKKLFQKKNP